MRLTPFSLHTVQQQNLIKNDGAMVLKLFKMFQEQYVKYLPPPPEKKIGFKFKGPLHQPDRLRNMNFGASWLNGLTASVVHRQTFAVIRFFGMKDPQIWMLATQSVGGFFSKFNNWIYPKVFLRKIRRFYTTFSLQCTR